MNYFPDGITKGPWWDELLDVCDKYFRLSEHLQDLWLEVDDSLSFSYS